MNDHELSVGTYWAELIGLCLDWSPAVSCLGMMCSGASQLSANDSNPNEAENRAVF
jgi:hypothetical protein